MESTLRVGYIFDHKCLTRVEVSESNKQPSLFQPDPLLIFDWLGMESTLRVSHSLDRKRLTRVEVSESNKRASLLQDDTNCRRKKVLQYWP